MHLVLTPTWAAFLFVLTSGTDALAEPLCSPFADTAETLDAIRYLDLPDPLPNAWHSPSRRICCAGRSSN